MWRLRWARESWSWTYVGRRDTATTCACAVGREKPQYISPKMWVCMPRPKVLLETSKLPAFAARKTTGLVRVTATPKWRYTWMSVAALARSISSRTEGPGEVAIGLTYFYPAVKKKEPIRPLSSGALVVFKIPTTELRLCLLKTSSATGVGIGESKALLERLVQRNYFA